MLHKANRNMVICCVAYNCSNRQTDKTISFHRFPHKNPKLLKLWILAIRRSEWHPTKLSFICSKHFKNEDFVSLKGPNSRPKLKKGAVPSVFDFPKHYKRLTVSYTASDDSAETVNSKKNIPIENKLNNPPDSQQIKKFILHDHNYGS